DQVRVPIGSAFFELYCTRNGNGSEAYLSADLYKNGQLDLGKLTPDGNNPVWRLAISESRIKSSGNDVMKRLTDQPDSTSLQPEQFNFAYSPSDPSGKGNPVKIERVVWFAPQAPVAGKSLDVDKIYYNHGSPTLLSPGSYAVVGPRLVTAIGRDTNSPSGLSSQKIKLNPSVNSTDASG